jgi:hypothetical protein
MVRAPEDAGLVQAGDEAGRGGSHNGLFGAWPALAVSSGTPQGPAVLPDSGFISLNENSHEQRTRVDGI